jgi:hypothetical protein
MALNMAVGCSWGGDPAGGICPPVMQEDWVRVYEDQSR